MLPNKRRQQRQQRRARALVKLRVVAEEKMGLKGAKAHGGCGNNAARFRGQAVI